MRLSPLLFALLLLALPAVAPAQDEETPPEAYTGPIDPIDPSKVPPQFQAVVGQLHPQHGTVVLGDNLATLTLPKDIAYLPPREADLYMAKIVGYQRHIRNLGIIVPSTVAIGSPASWSAIFTWRDDGYVKEDMAKVDPSLMETIKKENETFVARGRALGLGKAVVKVFGWTVEPSYDKQAHALSWGTEIAEGDSEEHKLNYFVRFLGRRQVVALSSVARLEQLPMIESAMPKVVGGFHFNAPNRYEDIAAGDPQASFGLADLIDGHMPRPKPEPKAPAATPAPAAKPAVPASK